MTENNSSESRRKLLKSIAAGSGAVIAGKNLPENWSKPVVDSVLLPAHAQTSQPIATTYSRTIRIDIPDSAGDSYSVPPFNFDDVSGYTPTGPGTVSIETLGDYFDGSSEYFSYTINDTGTTLLGQVPDPGGTGTQCGSTPETGSFPVSLVSLEQAAAGGTIVIAATNGGGVDAFCDGDGNGQYISVTLEFPALTSP